MLQAFDGSAHHFINRASLVLAVSFQEIKMIWRVTVSAAWWAPPPVPLRAAHA